MQQLERAAPSSEAVFLFSDIEGSTARWQMYADAMPVYLHRHDDLLRAAIEEQNGFVFKTVGDQFCAAFSSAENAVHAAIDIQRAINSADWTAIGGLRVRMAIHTGPATQRDGDYFGSTVNRVARLLSAGHGGQVLLSADTVEALPATALSSFSLRDLGRHRLKDFPELQSIYQLLAVDLPEIFPPLRTVAERPSNLPQHLPALLGREDELNTLRNELRRHRLTSIVGAGGVGKTAIALQLGANMLDSFEDGVWLAELAPVDAGSVDSTIASVFGLVSAAAGSITDALIAQLRNKNLLLVIDNCEHVADSAAKVIDAVLRNCANVSVVATSRQPLGLTGEISHRLPVLAIPAACELFAERARAHVPGFHITDENAKTVERICRRLDGIPLAIELAAPRLRLMNVTQLADRLAERFRVLTGGNRNTLPHHQTLRALIEWSYELLSENERVLLRRSALFPGGWTIGAAVEVCADESLEEWDILDQLDALVDKSLVVADLDEDEPRYRMLESTREYALERLEQSGERNIVALKHSEYFLRLARRADEAWPDVPAKAWIAPLNAELDNIRAALSWCVSAKNYPILGIRIFDMLEAFWWDAQPIEGRRWIEELREIADSDEASEEAGRYWLSAAGVALSGAKEKTALSAAEKALEIYQGLNDSAGIAAAQRSRGAALIRLGKLDEGEDATLRALETFRANGNRRMIAIALRTVATAPILRGEMEKAADVYREALALSQALQDERGVQIIAGNLAELEAHAGRYEEALAHAREAVEIARARQDWVMVCTLLINITAYLLMLDRQGEARSTAREALNVASEIQSDIHLTVAIQHLGAVSATCGDAARAARLLGYSDAAYARLENSREPTEAREYERAMTALKLRLPDDLEAHVRAGGLLTAEEAKSEALLT